MSEHTPGPWKTKKYLHCTAVESSSGSRIMAIGDHLEVDGKPCGSIASYDKTQAEIRANAKLISAAPELFEVLERLNRLPELPSSWRNRVESAIAKATGND